jgi:hypothetical protein
MPGPTQEEIAAELKRREDASRAEELERRGPRSIPNQKQSAPTAVRLCPYGRPPMLIFRYAINAFTTTNPRMASLLISMGCEAAVGFPLPFAGAYQHDHAAIIRTRNVDLETRQVSKRYTDLFTHGHMAGTRISSSVPASCLSRISRIVRSSIPMSGPASLRSATEEYALRFRNPRPGSNGQRPSRIDIRSPAGVLAGMLELFPIARNVNGLPK